MHPPQAAAVTLPLSISFGPDQVHWLTAQARARRISRSALVRQAVDLLISHTQTPPHTSDG